VAVLSIPERYQIGVSKIRELDLGTVRSLRQALDQSVYNEDHPQATAVATTALESISQSSGSVADFRNISQALVSMYLVKSRRDLSLEEFVDRVADALEELPAPELRLDAGERESFKEKLQILLGAEVFGVVSKVDDLRTESERIFCHARIITDMRPVFGSDVTKGPTAVLVTHNLKIAFHESGRKGDHEIYVTLDAEDLSDLKEIILRAEAKANTLRAIVDPKIKLFGA
jgi:predicted transcriptional regulator